MEEDEILNIHSILHLIFHRNKNQHGRTKWWKWLSILKRTVWNLALSLNSSTKAEARSSAEFYKQYLADLVVPRCYLAFSVVIADVQFSTLGTILLATLARLAKSTGMDKELKSRPQIETIRYDVSSPHMKIFKEKEDVGEALVRDKEPSDDITTSSGIQQTPQPVLVDSGSAVSSKASVTKDLDTPKPKKKKKRKKNAIDDLFDGLM
ncbi:hypothetical protein BDW59DRAFT_175817 [Aspergillus cavernicola]|uniref:RNase MRP protein 1 RNA binding domain-containing protein n=1 Tax=Aspergillus cavernicola TaxID=176166 RepID=A0ABR4HLK0_9EURO